VRVLVVDDNTDLADLMCDALAGEGFETAVAYDARAALEKWRSFGPHAAVLDVGMPDVDGYELARTLRAEYGATNSSAQYPVGCAVPSASVQKSTPVITNRIFAIGAPLADAPRADDPTPRARNVGLRTTPR